MRLSTAQKRFLRGMTHHINPVVMVGGKGLTGNVLAEIEQALDHHELIKVRMRTDRATRAVLRREIAERCSAFLVHSIGQIACYYRRNADKPVIQLPDG